MKRIVKVLMVCMICMSMIFTVVQGNSVSAASKTMTLDQSIKLKATKLIKSQTKSTSKATQLKAVWNYMKSKKNLSYKVKYPNLSTNNWAKKYANEMLSDKKGNCYGFACMFAACAYVIGYNPTIVCGRIRGSRDRKLLGVTDGYTRHAVVKIDGKWYDVEAAWSGLLKNCYAKKSYPLKFKSKKNYLYKNQNGSAKVTTTVSASDLANYTVTKDGDNYVGVDGIGQALDGIYCISGKLYNFKNGKMSVSEYEKYQKLIKEGQPYKDLKAEIGAAKSSKDLDESCYGKEMGKDRIYTYDNFEVCVFVPDSGGDEIIEDVDKSAETTSQDADAPISTGTKTTAAIVKKYAIKTGWKKINGEWYYFKKKKAQTGLKLISKKYYYFNSIGTQQTGLQKISGKTYYFKKASNGKAPMYTGKITIDGNMYYFKKVSGKSAAVTSKTAKISGTTYYFSSKGYGFKSLGNTNGNKAAALVFDNVKFTSSMSKKQKLEACYKYILTKISYSGVLTPTFNSNWYYETAYNTITNKKGKCYNYAALTGVVAKALGYTTKVVVGKSSYRFKGVTGDHAWVIVTSNSTTYVLDAVYDDTTPYGPYSSGTPKFFMNKYTKISGDYYQMKVSGSVDVDPTETLENATDITNYCYKETKRY